MSRRTGLAGGLAVGLAVVLAGVLAGVLVVGFWVWRSHRTTPGLTVSATGALGSRVAGAGQLAVDGDTPVRVGVSRLSGGSLRLVAGPSSSLPDAVRFPPYQATGEYPRAVLGLTPGSGDALTPGSGPFTFGAVLELDAVSSGRPEDNGDNAFQRGLSSEKDLFKLEMDHGRPACTMRGAGGTVVARAGPTVTPGTWYAVTCHRVGDRLTVSARPYRSSAGSPGSRTLTRSATGRIGAVTFSDDRLASVGGKLLPSGAVMRTASDQFNGAIARVWTRPS